MIKNCKNCKKEFKTFPCEIKRGHGIWCSKNCRPAWNIGLKGVIKGYWIGQKLSKEHRKNLSISHKGQKPWNAGIKGSKSGIKNGMWRGGITSLNKKERTIFNLTLRKFIFERDNYQCQMCDSKKDLQVDHIASWAEFRELRFNPENCRTLCIKCHYRITFGREMPKEVKTWGHNLGRRVNL